MTNSLSTECRTTADRFTDLKSSDLNPTEKETLVALAMSVLAARHRRGRALEDPGATRAYLQLKCADYRDEVFGCVFVDTRHRIIDFTELFQGTIDAAIVYPRVVVARALAVNASAVVFFHNHPSGVAEPSQSDRLLTRRLTDALALVDIRTLDHFVVGESESVSFAERGWL